MKTVITILGTILIVGYTNADPRSTAKYESDLNVLQDASVINFQWGTQKEVNEIWQAKYNGDVLGFAQYDIPGVLCTINAVKPSDWNDKLSMEVIGHELMHCIGAKHDNDNNGLELKESLSDELHTESELEE